MDADFDPLIELWWVGIGFVWHVHNVIPSKRTSPQLALPVLGRDDQQASSTNVLLFGIHHRLSEAFSYNDLQLPLPPSPSRSARIPPDNTLHLRRYRHKERTCALQ